MKTNNLSQHILIQLLNPGMYNDNILKSVLQEIEKSDVQELLSYRFNFQNLKPAVLPIQSEWIDKEFSDYFKAFSKKHSLELSNGTIYDINLHNLSHIVLQTNNQVAKGVANQVLSSLDKKLSKAKNVESNLSNIIIRNKHCNLNVAIKPEDFYKKNFSPAYFSSFDSFAVNLLTNGKISDLNHIRTDKKFVSSLLALIKNNPERLEDAVNLVDIATNNLAITLLENKDLADKICRVPSIAQSFWNIIKNNTQYSHYMRNEASQYLKIVNKEFSLTEKTDFLNQLLQLPHEYFQIAYKCADNNNASLSLSLSDTVDFIDKKATALNLLGKPSKTISVQQTQETHNFAYFMVGMLKPNMTSTSKIDECLDYVKSCLTLLDNNKIQSAYQIVNSSNSKNLMTESIQKLLKLPQLDLATIQKNEETFLRIVLLDTKLKKEAVSIMLEKGYHFKPTFELGSKKYKLAGLKLSKENLIKNEKNLLGQTLNLAAPKDDTKNKFKI